MSASRAIDFVVKEFREALAPYVVQEHREGPIAK
jgi:hypothetical protein